MSKKQSLADALRTPPAPAVAPPPAPRARQAAVPTSRSLQTLVRTPPPQPPRPRKADAPTSPQPPSRIGKKALIGYFDPAVSRQLKQMALDGDTTAQELLREALNDFFQKHKKPAIA